MQAPLTGRSILIVEDEPLIDMDMAGPLAEATEKKQAELDAAEEDLGRHTGTLEDQMTGLPHITMPGSKLEPGRGWPASGLAGAERRADQTLAARWLLEPAGDSRLRNAGARHCSVVSSSRSGPVPRAAS
jgi:hypothetical protein